MAENIIKSTQKLFLYGILWRVERESANTDYSKPLAVSLDEDSSDEDKSL